MKSKLKIILGIIIGIVLVSGISVIATTTILSSQVIYKNGQTVEDALNDLYSNKESFTKVVLGSNYSNNAHEFDATSIPGYQNLTVENFYLNKVSTHYFWPRTGTEKNYSSNDTIPNVNILSYNPETGKLTVDASMVQWAGSSNIAVCFHYEVVCIYN